MREKGSRKMVRKNKTKTNKTSRTLTIGFWARKCVCMHEACAHIHT